MSLVATLALSFMREEKKKMIWYIASILFFYVMFLGVNKIHSNEINAYQSQEEVTFYYNPNMENIGIIESDRGTTFYYTSFSDCLDLIGRTPVTSLTKE